MCFYSSKWWRDGFCVKLIWWTPPFQALLSENQMADVSQWHLFKHLNLNMSVCVSLYTVGVSVEKRDVRERVFTFSPVLLSHGTDISWNVTWWNGHKMKNIIGGDDVTNGIRLAVTSISETYRLMYKIINMGCPGCTKTQSRWMNID